MIEQDCRKYINAYERMLFLEAARKTKPEVYTFCRVLCETGCRISEGLKLQKSHLDLSEKCLYIETMKKRKKGIYRRVPVSSVTILQLLRIYERGHRGRLEGNDVFWRWSRMTGYRHICAVMDDAGIKGAHASPKGLRHGFAVNALESGVPLNMVQKWLGHAHWNTTSIYADMMGNEERGFAERMWSFKGAAAEEAIPPP